MAVALALSLTCKALSIPTGFLPGPLDSKMCLSLAQGIIISADSTNVVSLGDGWAPKPIEGMCLYLNVTALDHTTGDETYSFTVWESADNNSWTSTHLTIPITATGSYLAVFGSTAQYVKLIATLAGTTPSITFDAYVLPE